MGANLELLDAKKIGMKFNFQIRMEIRRKWELSLNGRDLVRKICSRTFLVWTAP